LFGANGEVEELELCTSLDVLSGSTCESGGVSPGGVTGETGTIDDEPGVLNGAPAVLHCTSPGVGLGGNKGERGGSPGDLECCVSEVLDGELRELVLVGDFI